MSSLPPPGENSTAIQESLASTQFEDSTVVSENIKVRGTPIPIGQGNRRVNGRVIWRRGSRIAQIGSPKVEVQPATSTPEAVDPAAPWGYTPNGYPYYYHHFHGGISKGVAPNAQRLYWNPYANGSNGELEFNWYYSNGGRTVWGGPIASSPTPPAPATTPPPAVEQEVSPYQYLVAHSAGYRLNPDVAPVLTTVHANGIVVWDKVTGPLAGVSVSFYDGSEDQLQDPDMVAQEGANKTPAYRGQIYAMIGFDTLAHFNNAEPAITLGFEDVEVITVPSAPGMIERMTNNSAAAIAAAANGWFDEDNNPRIESASRHLLYDRTEDLLYSIGRLRYTTSGPASEPYIGHNPLHSGGTVIGGYFNHLRLMVQNPEDRVLTVIDPTGDYVIESNPFNEPFISRDPFSGNIWLSPEQGAENSDQSQFYLLKKSENFVVRNPPFLVWKGQASLPIGYTQDWVIIEGHGNNHDGSTPAPGTDTSSFAWLGRNPANGAPIVKVQGVPMPPDQDFEGIATTDAAGNIYIVRCDGIDYFKMHKAPAPGQFGAGTWIDVTPWGPGQGPLSEDAPYDVDDFISLYYLGATNQILMLTNPYVSGNSGVKRIAFCYINLASGTPVLGQYGHLCGFMDSNFFQLEAEQMNSATYISDQSGNNINTGDFRHFRIWDCLRNKRTTSFQRAYPNDTKIRFAFRFYPRIPGTDDPNLTLPGVLMLEADANDISDFQVIWSRSDQDGAWRTGDDQGLHPSMVHTAGGHDVGNTVWDPVRKALYCTGNHFLLGGFYYANEDLVLDGEYGAYPVSNYHLAQSPDAWPFQASGGAFPSNFWHVSANHAIAIYHMPEAGTPGGGEEVDGLLVRDAIYGVAKLVGLDDDMIDISTSITDVVEGITIVGDLDPLQFFKSTAQIYQHHFFESGKTVKWRVHDFDWEEHNNDHDWEDIPEDHRMSLGDRGGSTLGMFEGEMNTPTIVELVYVDSTLQFQTSTALARTEATESFKVERVETNFIMDAAQASLQASKMLFEYEIGRETLEQAYPPPYMIMEPVDTTAWSTRGKLYQTWIRSVTIDADFVVKAEHAPLNTNRMSNWNDEWEQGYGGEPIPDAYPPIPQRVAFLDPGTYLFSGYDVLFSRTRGLLAAPGSYVFTGVSIDFLRPNVLQLDPGSYTFTGHDLAFARGGRITLESGSYTFTGVPVTFVQPHKTAQLATGSYAITGIDLQFSMAQQRTVAMEPATYVFTGVDVEIRRGREIDADPGAYVFTGVDIPITRARRELMASGSYLFTGVDATFTANQGSGGVTPHRYWRLHTLALTQGFGNFNALSELQFRTAEGVSAVPSGGTPIYSSQLSGGEAAKAFDGNAGTFWAPSSAGTGDHWIGYDFGAGNEKNVLELAITARNDGGAQNQGPVKFQLEYSDDGLAWTAATPILRMGTPWGAGETRAHSLVAGARSHWRILYTADTAGFNAYAGIGDIQFRPTAGVASAATGGTASASSTGFGAGGFVDGAFDDDPTTHWHSNFNAAYDQDGSGGQWIQYAYPVARSVSEVRLVARNGDHENMAPVAFDVLSSKDGGIFEQRASYTGQGGWTDGQVKRYPVPTGTVIQGDPVVAYRYWRVQVLRHVAGSTSLYQFISEVEFRSAVGGSDLLVAGSGLHLFPAAGFSPGNAYDNNTATEYQSIGNNVGKGANFWGYDFGVSPVEIVEISYRPRASLNANQPADLELQYSSDNKNWTPKSSHQGLTWSSGTETKVLDMRTTSITSALRLSQVQTITLSTKLGSARVSKVGAMVIRSLTGT